MRKINYALVTTILLACSNSPNFSDPKSVIEKYYLFQSQEKLEKDYELLADTCKEFASLQDFLNFYSGDTLFLTNQYSIQKITQLPLDPNNPKYRLFEIAYKIIIPKEKDTINSYTYRSVINEKGKWKVVWTGNIADAASKMENRMDLKNAIDAYNKVLKYDPLNGSAFREIGWCNYRLGNYALALSNAKKTLELSPQDESNYNLLASIYSSQNNPELAIENYKKAISMIRYEEEKVYLLSNMVDDYLSLNKVDDAKETINQAIKIDSSDTHAWWRKAAIFTKIGNKDSTIICLEKAVTLDPMDDYLQCQLYYDLSYQLYSKAKSQETTIESKQSLIDIAKKNILKALDLQSDNVEYKQLLNEINKQNNE